MGEYGNLLAACLTFVGSHFAMSHPLRRGMNRRLGARGFMLAYSVVSLGSFVWMIMAFRAAPAGGALLWDGTGAVAWIIATLMTLLASLLLAGSFSGNPALPDPAARLLTAREPSGALRVTRHPMMWGFALWAFSHMLIAPRPPVLWLTGSIAFLALAGSLAQDAKKRRLMGPDWKLWEGKTSFLPNLLRLGEMGWGVWLAGLLLWLAAQWAHGSLAGLAAGIFRWL